MDQMATHDDSVREYARNVGRENPDRAWILDPRDVWSANPFYCGPAVPHPEDDYAYDEEDAEARTDADEPDDFPF